MSFPTRNRKRNSPGPVQRLGKPCPLSSHEGRAPALKSFRSCLHSTFPDVRRAECVRSSVPGARGARAGWGQGLVDLKGPWQLSGLLDPGSEECIWEG